MCILHWQAVGLCGSRKKSHDQSNLAGCSEPYKRLSVPALHIGLDGKTVSPTYVGRWSSSGVFLVTGVGWQRHVACCLPKALWVML